jgi:hypothetical protein
MNDLSIKETVDGVYVYPILEFEKVFLHLVEQEESWQRPE